MNDERILSATRSETTNAMSRRSFFQKTTVAAMALGTKALSMPSVPNYLQPNRLGLVVHSYAHRWHSRANSQQYPGFTNAIDLLNHCHQLGAGGVQVGVKAWSVDFAHQVRQTQDDLGLYVEGSIGLPKDADEATRFEQEVKTASEAGIKVLRTVCLSGRRYENFHSPADFATFKKNSLASLLLAEPIVRRHRMQLAVENHKDWRADELVRLLQQIDSEWIGVTLDFGNSISLLEDPMEVVEALVPYVFTTHVKDMALATYDEGFLLSEVPLGKGILDLPRIVSLCKKHNPKIVFNLEMITRDPLRVPCLSNDYWATFPKVPGSELARTLRMVRHQAHTTALPQVSQLNKEDRLATEEKNVVASLVYSKNNLSLT